MEDPVEKVRRLLKLAQSDNPSEAANAMAMAQRIMARHRVTEAQLEQPDLDEIALWRDEPLERGGAIAGWRQALGGAIAEANDCLCLLSTEPDADGQYVLTVAGRRADFDAVLVMYRWIIDRIDAIARAQARRHAAGHGARMMGRRWIESFRQGAAAEVEVRVHRERRRQVRALAVDPKTASALAVRHDAVDRWAEENIAQEEPPDHVADVDSEAFALGALAGRIMPLRSDDDPR